MAAKRKTKKQPLLASAPALTRRVLLLVTIFLTVTAGYLLVYFTHAATSYVHVSGTSIYDGSGNHIYLSGVDGGGNMARGGDPAHNCPSWSAAPGQAASLKQLGYNTERIAVAWADLEPTAPTISGGTLIHHWDNSYLQALDGIIQADSQAGIMAIIDMHQAGWSPFFQTDPKLCEGGGMPYWLYNSGTGENTAKCEFFSNTAESGVTERPIDGMAAAWSMLGARYNGNATVIGADLFNEPLPPTGCGSGLASMYEQLGAAARQGDPNLILMYEDNAYDSYMNQGFKLDRKPNLTNALYSWHLYAPDWSTGLAPMQAHLQRAHQDFGVPLWIGETDAMGATRTSDLTAAQQPNLISQMNYFKQNDISWTLWGYDNGCCTIVNPSGSTTAKPLLENTLLSYMYQPPHNTPTPTPGSPTPTPPPTPPPTQPPSGSPSPSTSPTGGGTNGGGSGNGGTGDVQLTTPGAKATVTVNGVPVQTTNGQLDTTYLPNGTYTVKVTQNGQTSTKTIQVNNKLNPFESLRDFLFARFTGNHFFMNAATVAIIASPFAIAAFIFRSQLVSVFSIFGQRPAVLR